ncbi:MAG: DNA polymerase III subunit alpha, partial [Trueperaceae bacterium]|nr:DNA polymerase III subunit alpha [Trueperaceae bacterium]
MARTCEMVRERQGIDLCLESIPLDDPKTYELLGKGEVIGIFQVEGAGMRRFLMEMKPAKVDDVIAMVALFRPGPMEFIPSYIRRMHGEEEVSYLHPALEPIFDETYGIPVYQEQIMRAAVELAGFSAAQADHLRKAISKKDADELRRHRESFVQGAVGKGLPADIADRVFSDWEDFARYGFNRAHAAAYGAVAVQTA